MISQWISQIKSVITPRRGIHARRGLFMRLLLMSALVLISVASVTAFYELYRIDEVAERAVEKRISEVESKKIPVVLLTQRRAFADEIGGAVETKYVDEALVPEDKIDALTLRTGVYLARRDISAGVILTKQDIVSEEEKTPDDMKLREYKDKIDIPEGTQVGDVVDVVLTRSHEDGTYEEFIVLSDKRVEYLNGRVLHLAMENNEERYLMGKALTEVELSAVSSLRLDHYLDPQIQAAAKVTYKSVLEEYQDEKASDTATSEKEKEEDEVKENDSITVSPSEPGQGGRNNDRTGGGNGAS